MFGRAGVRAAVSATTRVAPDFFSDTAAAESVAPVVATSSISNIKLLTGRTTEKLGALRRSAPDNPVWGGPRLRRRSDRVG